MPKLKRDQVREDRIHNEAIVDAYGPEEQALGWYYYLENKIRFPLQRPNVAGPRRFRPSSRVNGSKSAAWHRKTSAPLTCSYRSTGTAAKWPCPCPN